MLSNLLFALYLDACQEDNVKKKNDNHQLPHSSLRRTAHYSKFAVESWWAAPLAEVTTTKPID
jgi:hypothetical protein